MFDDVFTPLGLGLIAFGLYLVVSNRARARSAEGSSNKVEAFGIKIDVSNPSVLLILLGVGLVLVPKFAPDVDPSLAVNAPEVPPLTEPPAVAENRPPVPLAKTEAVEVVPVLPDEPTAAGLPPGPVAPAAPVPDKPQPARQPKPQPAAVPPPVVTKPNTGLLESPKVARAPIVRSVPKAADVTAPVVPVKEPKLWVLVDAEVSEDAGIRGISAEEYSRQLRDRLAHVAAGLFGDAQVSVTGDQQVAKAGKQGVCAASPTPKVILATLSIPTVFSDIESAYWPDLQVMVINCDDGRFQRSAPKRLTPKRSDQVYFESDFVDITERFLSSRSYFLQ